MSGRRQERASGGRSSSRRATTKKGKALKDKKAANTAVFERRFLMGVTIFTMLGSILWIVAISTDYWYTVSTTSPDGILIWRANSSLVRADVGLWRVCRTQRPVIDFVTNETGDPITKCRNHDMFPSRKEVKSKKGEVDHVILDFYRTETAFAIIALILMLMGHGFSLYTFIEQRYMYKRLAGGVHFLTAATVLVVVEVLKNSAHYATEKLKYRHPTGSDWHFGYSYGLAWVSFISFVVAGISFLVLSRKRKGRRAINELHATADEPQILGRV